MAPLNLNNLSENSNKRKVAYKLKIGDINLGKPVIDNERFVFLELGEKKVTRVNVIGVIVDKFQSEPSGDKRYVFLTVDDGSGQLRLKVFGQDYERFKDLSQGQTVVVIGLLRHWNNELYVAPEIIRELVPKYLLLRNLELEKEKPHKIMTSREEVIAVKDKVLGLIKDAEKNEGIDTVELFSNLKNFSPEIINQEIQKLIEEGIIFEPRPGRIRYLG